MGNETTSAASSAHAAVEPETQRQSRQETRAQAEQNTNPQAGETDNALPLQTSLGPAPAPERIIQQPVAFAEASPNPEASAEEVAEINALRQQFINQIGGYDQDPTDPGYRERWKVAQQLLDEQLRSELGEEVFSRLQNENANSQLSGK